jgi:hypothetical protein
MSGKTVDQADEGVEGDGHADTGYRGCHNRKVFIHEKRPSRSFSNITIFSSKQSGIWKSLHKGGRPT